MQAVLTTTTNNPLVRIPLNILRGVARFVLGLLITAVVLLAHPAVEVGDIDHIAVPTTGAYLRFMAMSLIYLTAILGIFTWMRSRALAGKEKGGGIVIGLLVISALAAMCIYSGTYFAGEPWGFKPGTQTAGVDDVVFVNGWIHLLMLLGSVAGGWWLTFQATIFDAINPAFVAERAVSETVMVTVPRSNASVDERLAKLGEMYGCPLEGLKALLPPVGDTATGTTELTLFYVRGRTVRDWATLDAVYASRGLVPADPRLVIDANLAMPDFGYEYSHTTSWVDPTGERVIITLVRTYDSDNPSWIRFGKKGPERGELIRSGFWAAGVKPASQTAV